ncbi:MAG: helix-turn-helix transcriptional regulator [Actinomycetota bacterium]
MTATTVTAAPATIVGREPELEAIAGLIDRVGDESRTLLLEGEPGIGKTTLWRWGVDRARETGHIVIACRPSETEAALPFAALGDLLEPTLPEILPTLTPLQQIALEAALARIEPDEALGRLAIARAALAAIKELAGKRLLVIAIDDAQWLDPPSAEALRFVIRRLDGVPVRILVARRQGETAAPLDLHRSVPSERLSVIGVDPLSVGELDSLLNARLGLRLERARLVELQRITGGNPFYALEVARVPARGEDFAVPDSLGALLRDRLRALSATGRDAMLLAAATTQPSATLIEKAAGGSAGLAEAVHQGLLEFVGKHLVFAHPLLASVTYTSALPGDRRKAHRRLAAASKNPLDRARQLALATEDSDEAIAGELDAAALRAQRLGAPGAAADLADHACRLTPKDRHDVLLARSARSAEYHLAAGNTARGRALLEHVVGSTPSGTERARLLLRLGRARIISDNVPAAHDVLQQALAEAGSGVRLRAEIEQALAFTVIGTGDITRAHQHALSSLHLAQQLDDPGVLALSLSRVVLLEFVLGMGFDRERMEQAVDLEDRIGEAPLEWRPSYVHAFIALCVDELETARGICARLHASILELGDERDAANILIPMSMIERAAGNWSLAGRYADEAVERSRQSGLDTLQAGALAAQALVCALLGQEQRARAVAEEGLAIAGRIGAVPWMVWIVAALGVLELSLGDAEAAHLRLGPLSEMVAGVGPGDPGVVRFLPDDIEALVALGEIEQARVLTEILEERGRTLDRPWALATGARSAALLAAAEGDFDRASDAIARALAEHERLGQPFELGRTLLIQGTIDRRAKRRGAARGSLTAALDIFDSLGASLWAERAGAELARVSGRARASGELTSSEKRVAELVATGLSNKEIAAQLFVSVRTVESNLSKVYAKLGARSRTELVARLAEGSIS